MGKKAPRKNGFSCFVLEFKKRMRFNGSFPEAIKLAAGPWEKLSQEEKDRYKKIADDYNKSEERAKGLPNPPKKRKPSPPPPNRALTIKEAKPRREKLFIQNLIQNMTMNDLLDHVFYLIHVNYFCKTLDEEFVPAEISISRFTLREGVTDVFHRILNPGVTPLGYSYEIKVHSEKTHRIPLDFVKATRGYLGMYKGITDFIRSRNDPDKMSHLYTMFDEPFHNCSMSAVKYSLKRIWETCNTDDEEDGEIEEDEQYEKVFQVMSLPVLFYYLKNKCASTYNDLAIAFENTSQANIELLNDRYEFTEELACQYHQDIDNVRYCSQSYTVRWAQVMRDQCLKYLQCDEEEEEEEEKVEENVQLEVNEIKQERVQGIKEERTENRIKENDALKQESQPIKSEREIKKEKDDIRVKVEKDSLQSEPTRNRPIKLERDIKKEKDDIRVKVEKDNSQREPPRHRPIKLEREIKKEKNDIRVKVEKDSSQREPPRHRPIKLERDFDDLTKDQGDHRRYDDDGIKKERNYDSILKTEHVDIPFDIETERSGSQESGYRDSRFSRGTLRTDNSHVLKTECEDIPLNIKTERFDNQEYHSRDPRLSRNALRTDNSHVLKTECEDIPLNIKTERFDNQEYHSRDPRLSRNALRTDNSHVLKTECEDIPLNIKTERFDNQESRSRDPRLSRDNSYIENSPAIKTKDQNSDMNIKTERYDSRDPCFNRETTQPDYNSILKTEHYDIPFDIKTERVDNEDIRSQDPDNSAGISRDPRCNNEGTRDPRLRTKSEKSQWDSRTPRSDNFPMPIPIKTERSDNEGAPSNRLEFPLPIPIKIEKDSPLPIKVEKQNGYDDFPKPPIKVEKGEKSQTTSQAQSLEPMVIKTEKPESSQIAERSQNSNNVPLSIKIKVEKDEKIKEEPSCSNESSSKSRKRTRDFVDLCEEDYLKSNTSRIKTDVESDSESMSNFAYGNVRIKNEPEDSYSSHGMKNEEFNINPEDFDIEPMECDNSFIQGAPIKTENEIKKENQH